MKQHTPGPWKATEQGQIYHQPPMEPNTFVPHVNIGQVYGPNVNPHAADDAHLIAAAPDLLAACEALGAFTRDLLKLVSDEHIQATGMARRMLKVNDQAYNALAKARGKEASR